jgi:hypothetical protein
MLKNGKYDSFLTTCTVQVVKKTAFVLPELKIEYLTTCM